MPGVVDKNTIVREIYRCAKDPVYFIKHYCKIAHPQQGLIPFKLWEFQEELIQDYKDHRFNVILKSRQLGVSTVTAGYCAWLMLFHREKNILVFAIDVKTSVNLVKKVKSMVKFLPPFFGQLANITIDNRTSFNLSNGSEIKASPTKIEAGRSEALSLLVVDEAAHVSNMEEIWAALGPTMAAGGRCIALSTPKGSLGWFYDIYTNAEAGLNNFHPIKLMWDVHPERDEVWFEKEKKNYSKKDFAQEYLCNFSTSGDTVIHPEDLLFLSNSLSDPIFKTGIDGNLYIWEEYKHLGKYMIVADVARGDGRDCSAFHVIELENMKQVAEYNGKLTTDIFARLLVSTAEQYGKSLIVIENNNIGFEVCNKLIEYEYPNIYFSIKGSHEMIEQYRADQINNSVPGFSTSSKTRPLIIAKLEEYIRNKAIQINSKRTLNELQTFIWKNGRPEAGQGYNDDLVMSLAIACWIRDTVLEKTTRGIAAKRAALKSITKRITVINDKIPGQISLYKQNGSNSRQINLPNSETAIKRRNAWLIKG